MDSVDARHLEACAMISFISNFDEGSAFEDQGVLLAVGATSALLTSAVARGYNAAGAN